MPDMKNRRPLNSRNTSWARKITRLLATSGITPNQISQLSMVAALIAGVAFWMSGANTDPFLRGGILVSAALFCQIRLLCNLFDGMVAVEAGKSSSDGPLWNELPDRVSDVLILVGIGIGVASPALGWAAATFAVLTAYTRELGASIGLEPDFSGPMAKPHRMALVTIAAILAALEPIWLVSGTVMTLALWVVTMGSAFTVLKRANKIRELLLKRKST